MKKAVHTGKMSESKTVLRILYFIMSYQHIKLVLILNNVQIVNPDKR